MTASRISTNCAQGGLGGSSTLADLNFFLRDAPGGISAHAQQATGSIAGTISDSSGAIVPGASVTISNKSTGAVRSMSTNAEGLFSAPGLEAGEYRMHAERQGFRTVERVPKCRRAALQP